MSLKPLKIIIAGGGTAGWMTAIALIKQLNHCVDVTLIESEDIGTVGVGEATIPTIQTFHRLIGLDEYEFIKETNATFKLGIAFENWGAQQDSYFHSFGDTGNQTWAGEFQHFWRRAVELGVGESYGSYSLETQAALAGKFAITEKPRMNYAYHFDAGLYAAYLRRLSEKMGVVRVEGKIQRVNINTENGFISNILMETGIELSADLFVDCTGFRSLLMGSALGVGYEDWSHWLPCDSAVAVQTKSEDVAMPYTRAIAQSVGWRWRIPLQHRIGNGYVYSSKFISDESARDLFLSQLNEPLVNQPRVIKFATGRRKASWFKNCIVIGLSSGFIEPLESTSIHLISSSVVRLMRLLPLRSFDLVADEFNRQANMEIEAVRDFVILHYHATTRTDSDFWNYCRNIEIPEKLRIRMELFKESARIFRGDDELFTINSWNQVMLGQRLMPQTYHPIADVMSPDELKGYLMGLKNKISQNVSMIPAHHKFIESIVKE